MVRAFYVTVAENHSQLIGDRVSIEILCQREGAVDIGARTL
jgi:hypothetical protein